MSEYKGVTHTIVDLIEARRKSRKEIQNVPRNRKTPRKELPLVGRPDNERDDGTQTKQDEVQTKVIDETRVTQSDNPDTAKRKKLELKDIGKQKPTQVEVNPEIDKANIFSSNEPKGKPLTETGHKDPFITDHGKEQDVTDVKTGKVVMKLPRYGVWKYDEGRKKHQVTHTGNDLDALKKQHGVSDDRVTKLKEETITEFTTRPVDIQYQDNSGNWISARKTSPSSSDIFYAMQSVQKTYNTNKIRAVDFRGTLVDLLPQPPGIAQPPNVRNPIPDPVQSFQKVSFPSRREPISFGQALGAWWRGETIPEETDKDRYLGKSYKHSRDAARKRDDKRDFVEDPKGQIAKQNTGWKSRMAWIKGHQDKINKSEIGEDAIDELSKETINKFWKGKLSVKQLNKRVKKDREDELDKKEQKLDEGNPNVISAGIKNTMASGAISSALSNLKKAYPKTANTIDKIQSAYSDVTKFSPGYAAFATQKDMLPSNIVTDYIAKNKAKKDAEQKEGTQVSPGVRTVERGLKKVLEARQSSRHAGIETDEPKFSQSIQKIAAHTKWNAGAVHTYTHRDGSKTRVDQDLGEKIHKVINTTPNRHKAGLIQHIHKSADNLKHVLKHGWHGDKK